MDILRTFVALASAAALLAGYAQSQQSGSSREALARLGADASFYLDQNGDVEQLVVRSRRIDSASFKMICDLPGLRSLTFQGEFNPEQLSSEDLRQLNQCQHLSTVVFACWGHIDAAFLEVLPDLANVKEFRFLQTAIGRRGSKLLAACKKVECLEIDGDSEIDDSALQALAGSPRLSKLKLKDVGVSPDWRTALENSPMKPSLREVRIFRGGTWEIWRRRLPEPAVPQTTITPST